MQIATTFSVPAMHCTSCVILLEGLEDKLPGVVRVEVNLKRQQLQVWYDSEQVSEEHIMEAAKEEGYSLELLSGKE